jgi:histidyl-tRNA synthetase
MAQKPSIPKGTRDFSPAEVAKRNYIISIMRNHFEKFGYQPIETPSFENSDTLMGKYGDEGDRLIFKILNSGEFLLDFNKLILAYLRTIYGRIIVELSKEKEESRIDDYLKILLSKNFIQEIVDEVNNENSEYKLYNFYNKSLISSIRSEINSIRKSDYIKDDLLRRVLNECKDCDPRTHNDVKKIIRKFAQDTYGKWMSNIESKNLTKQISEKALRYDLTVPFARYVVQHQSEIEFPFKRYQIQPVWRADRPQKGRFREFYQCDADVVGSTSLWQEVELVQLYDSVFTDLGLEGVTIKINNRKILSGITEVIGASDKLIDFTVALDKLDKIGEEGVKKEMLEKGISAAALQKVQPLFHFTGTIHEKLDKLTSLLSASEEGKKGISELQFICDNIAKLGLKKSILDLDVTLARGLNYYTGAIFEVAPPNSVSMGSIGGGGRYDDLTGIFGLKDMSGVGISFGLDRIYLVLEELNLFPQTVTNATKVLFLNFGESQTFDAMKAITLLRNQNIKAEMYPDNAKIDKQFKHAERRGIPFVVKEILGSSFMVKDIQTGDQMQLNSEELIHKLSD